MRRVSECFVGHRRLLPIARVAGAQEGVRRTPGSSCRPDFAPTIFADSLPGVRSIAVAPNGDLFVALQNAARSCDGGVMALRDARQDGQGGQTRDSS